MPASPASTVIPIILLLVFVSVILLVEGAWLLWRARRGAAALRLQRRLDLVANKAGATTPRPLLKTRQLSDLSSVARALTGVTLAARLERVIGQAGLHWTVARLVLSSATAGAVGFGLGMQGAQPAAFDVLLAALFATLPWAYVMVWLLCTVMCIPPAVCS